MVGLISDHLPRSDIMTNVAQLVFPLVPCPRREEGSLCQGKSWRHLVTVETTPMG